ncbi:hypothetical protein FALBO_5138 [Fusarium albosuccineum]|uniref:Uncharacterized protein n=1 Tax=Fusarium albosuccineum TaxID=1237068 RepID=A0A8H4LHZ3_9HYPO|nr:hypothetical protein FALBO_5138 [Fusarium albosuccineum]
MDPSFADIAPKGNGFLFGNELFIESLKRTTHLATQSSTSSQWTAPAPLQLVSHTWTHPADNTPVIRAGQRHIRPRDHSNVPSSTAQPWQRMLRRKKPETHPVLTKLTYTHAPPPAPLKSRHNPFIFTDYYACSPVTR